MSVKVEKAAFSLDDILSELGQFGKYQLITYAYIILPIMLSAVYNAQYIFNAGSVNYRCYVPECESSSPNYSESWITVALPDSQSEARCSRYAPLNGGANCSLGGFNHEETISCDRWVYENDHTIVSEFDLACQEWKRTMVGTVHSVGLLCALPYTSLISDAYGRKTALILTAISPGILGVIRSFMNSYYTYLAFEFLESMFGSGVYSTGFILALELVGVERRVIGGNIISSFYAVGQVMLGLLAWWIPQWRTLTRVIYAPSLLFVFYYFIISESIRWLWSKGKTEQAKDLILKAAETNNAELSEKSLMALSKPVELKVTNSKDLPITTEKKASLFMQVITSKIMVSRVIICSFWWITTTLVYYGLSINSVSLSGNQYLNYILVSLIEIPGYVLSVLTLNRFGRKHSIMSAYLICGVALVLLPFVPERLEWLKTILAMTGKLSVSMAFSSIYIYTTELFPTVTRHSLLGTCSMVGRIGSIAAPQTPLLAAYWASLPFLVFGAFSFTSGILMLFTPETLNRRLPDTIEEAEVLSKQKE